MNPFSLFKGIAGIIASAGAASVVSNAIKHTTPYQISNFNKVFVLVGDFVVSAIVADKANDFVEEKLDELFKKKDSNVKVKVNVDISDKEEVVTE